MTLPEPRTPAGRAGLAALLADPGRALLGFDFDGTLAPIVPDPTAARPHPGALPALAQLAAYVGHLAVVTGRPARTAVEYAGLDRTDDPRLDALRGRLVVLGHYGLERWDASTGEFVAPPPPPGVDVVRRALPGLLADAGAGAGTVVEDKGSSLAVHTRRAAAPEAEFQRLLPPLTELAERAQLVVEPGRLVIELRPPGVDKGGALLSLVDDLSAAGGRPSVVGFFGDDLGDLPAFDAVDQLRATGVPGLLVGSGSVEVTAVAERADLVVDGPAGVVALLEALSAALAPS